MIRYPLIILLLGSQLFSQEKKYGYSFLAAGMQSSIYAQSFDTTGKDYTLKSDITSPYYITGNLTRINARYGFEIISNNSLLLVNSKISNGSPYIM